MVNVLESDVEVFSIHDVEIVSDVFENGFRFRSNRDLNPADEEMEFLVSVKTIVAVTWQNVSGL